MERSAWSRMLPSAAATIAPTASGLRKPISFRGALDGLISRMDSDQARHAGSTDAA